LAGKNLSSDSAVGGAITSVPQVLGTQIARLEEFGISSNPESFAVYGYDKYFSDQKRGVLLQLKGSGYQNEQLTVISEAGMRSWFRDKFIASPNTQKLGGYDPYMDEYVFSLNDNKLPTVVDCIECGNNSFFNYALVDREFCFNLGQLVGDVTIKLNTNFIETGLFQLSTNYRGVVTTTTLTQGPKNIVFNKDTVSEEDVIITFTGSVVADVNMSVSCPEAKTIEIIQVCVSDNVDAGQFIHNQYRWIDGTFTSPLHQEQVQLDTSNVYPIVSQYNTISGLQGAGVIPADGADVSIISNKISPTDTFVFANPPMNFKYLRSSVLYANTPAAIQNLLDNPLTTTLSVDASGAPSTYVGEFTMPTGSSGDYLYLIYDYREPVLFELCYSATSALDACCNCTTPPPVQ